MPDPSADLQSERGADVLLVASTGVGTTLLAASAYERYRQEQLLATLVEAARRRPPCPPIPSR